jgi:hypothetical protein
MKSSCFYCGYYKEEKRANGTTRHYCNDKDCTVDPYDPECNYDED